MEEPIKYIGFIKRHDLNRSDSKELADMFIEQEIDAKLRASIIDYLSSGNFLFGWMHYECEEDGTLIGPSGYNTDGCYVWPHYYIHYLKKFENLEISKDFIEHVKQNNFVVPELSKEHLNSLENLYIQDGRRNLSSN